MKILRSTGHGVQAKLAKPLTINEEDQYTPVTILCIYLLLHSIFIHKFVF